MADLTGRIVPNPDHSDAGLGIEGTPWPDVNADVINAREINSPSLDAKADVADVNESFGDVASSFEAMDDAKEDKSALKEAAYKNVGTGADDVAAGDHGHAIRKIDGLSTELEGKLPAWAFASATGTVSAVAWTHYLADASDGAVTVTLPASPTALDQIAVTDANNTATTNTITVATNGHSINGDSDGLLIDQNGGSVTLTFTGTQWVVIGIVAGASA